MLTDLRTHWDLVLAFANRDLSTRYRASALGWAWSLVQPLATLIIFSAVFSIIFRVQAPPLGNGSGDSNYAAFIFTGIVTWTLFSGTLTLSMSQLKSNRELLKKVQMPAWPPVLGASLVQLIEIALMFLVLVVMFLFLGNVGWTWLIVIPILLGLFLFSQGVGFMLSILNAHFDDVQYIVTVLLGALYFLTPVLYPMSLLEGQNEILSWVITINPIGWYVQSMHDVMYSLTSPEWWVIALLVVGGALVFWLGFSVFQRSSRDIGEVL